MYKRQTLDCRIGKYDTPDQAGDDYLQGLSLIHISLAEIATACGGTYVGDDSLKTVEVNGVVIDSRKVEPGYLFVAVKGERVDGHTFIPVSYTHLLFLVQKCEISKPDPHFFFRRPRHTVIRVQAAPPGCLLYADRLDVYKRQLCRLDKIVPNAMIMEIIPA